MSCGCRRAQSSVHVRAKKKKKGWICRKRFSGNMTLQRRNFRSAPIPCRRAVPSAVGKVPSLASKSAWDLF
eukprot:2331969-Prymnesium_polylepis.1